MAEVVHKDLEYKLVPWKTRFSTLESSPLVFCPTTLSFDKILGGF